MLKEVIFFSIVLVDKVFSLTLALRRYAFSRSLRELRFSIRIHPITKDAPALCQQLVDGKTAPYTLKGRQGRLLMERVRDISNMINGNPRVKHFVTLNF